MSTDDLQVSGYKLTLGLRLSYGRGGGTTILNTTSSGPVFSSLFAALRGSRLNVGKNGSSINCMRNYFSKFLLPEKPGKGS